MKKSEKEDKLKLVRDRLTETLSRPDVQENRRLYIEDIRFAAGNSDNGWQWDQDVWNKSKVPGQVEPLITINMVSEFLNQVRNDARQNRPQAKVLPVDDGADVETAQVFDGLIRNIEQQSNADTAYDSTIDCSTGGGFGYWRYVSEYVDDESFDQEIRVLAVNNPLCIIDDPDIQTPEGRDRNWCFVIEKLKKSEYDAGIGKDHPISWDLAKDAAYRGWIETDECVVAEYWRYEEQDKIVKQGKKERVAKVRKVICSKTNGVEEWDKKEWAGKWIPIVRVPGNLTYIEGRTYTAGLVRAKKDAQKVYNYMETAQLKAFALTPKAPFMAPVEAIEGFEEDYQSANVGNKAYLPYNAFTDAGIPIPKPERQMPPIPQQAIMLALQGARENLKSTSGQYSASLGQQSNETSGRAIIARQREGDVATFHYIDYLSNGQKFGGEILVDAIPKYYDTKRVVRIIGEDGSTEHVQLDPDSPQSYVPGQKKSEGIYNLNVGKYDVAVSVGPSYTTKRQEGAQALQEVIRAAPDLMGVVGDIFMRSMDFPYADEAAKRLKKALPPPLQDDEEGEEIPPQAQAQMMEMQQQNQQLSQALEEMMNNADVKKAEAETQKAAAESAKAEAEVIKTDASMELEREKIALERDKIQLEREKMGMEANKAHAELQAKGLEQSEDGQVIPIVPLLQQVIQGLGMLGQGMEALMIATQAQGEQLAQGLQQVASLAGADRIATMTTIDGNKAAISRVVPQQLQ